jgi:anti-sigma factor RsiW
MKWLFNKCRRYEAGVSLLAAGALPEEERTGVVAHLAGCAACRARLVELQSLAYGLTRLGESLPQVEPPASLQRRWMKQVRESAKPETVHPTCGEIFGWLSGRRAAWGSLAAVWGLILFFNVTAPEVQMASQATLPVAPGVLWQMFKLDRQTAMLTGWSDGLGSETGPLPAGRTPKPIIAPPRSEQRGGVALA